MKTLKSFLEVYKPKSPDEQKFVDKHVTIKHKDRNEVNGKANEDDVFNASNIKPVDRKTNRQGYDVGEDEKVYEEVDVESMDEQELLDFALGILEKTLTPAELKKREEIAKAMERENPNMPMAKKMAIATAQAKKVAEEVEQIDEISSQLASSYLQKKRERDYDTSADGTYSKMKKPQPLNKIHRDIKSTVRALRTIEKSNKTNEEVEINEVNHYVVAKGQKGWFVNQHTGPYASDVWHHSVQTGYHSTKNEAVAWAKKHAGGREHKIDIKEELDLDEGLMHDRYMRSHGKKARGTGSWAFTTKQYGSPKEKDMHFTSGQKSLSDAHKEAAAKLGTKNLYVMEEVEQIDELSKKTLRDYIVKASSPKQHFSNKGEKRDRNITKAVSKLNTEETEAPFEGPYRKPGERKDKYGNTIKNVPRHLAKQAMKSLKKEDIIDRAFDRYIPEQYKFTPVERLLNRLNGLSEAHVDLVLNLFNSLNEDNQMVVLEQVNTVEGVNRLLDFAIQNRGE